MIGLDLLGAGDRHRRRPDCPPLTHCTDPITGRLIGIWPFSSGEPKRPSDVDVSDLRGPGGRSLAPEEQRFSRAFAAFNDVVAKWRETNPSHGSWLDPFVKLRDEIRSYYVDWVKVNDPEFLADKPDKRALVARKLGEIADVMERLYGEAHRVATDRTSNKVRDIKDEVDKEATRRAFESAADDFGAWIKRWGKTITDPVLDPVRAVPWIIGGVVLAVAVVGGIFAWRSGSTVLRG